MSSSITVNGVRVPVAVESLRITKENIFPIRRTYRGDGVGWRLQERKIIRLRTRPLTRVQAILYETIISGKATNFPLIGSNNVAGDGNVPVTVITQNKNYRMPAHYVGASKGTLMARVQISSTSAVLPIFTLGTTGDPVRLRISTTGKLELCLTDLNTATSAGPTSVALNTPFHVAMTWSAGRIQAWLNGVQQLDLVLPKPMPFDVVGTVSVVDIGTSAAGLTWMRDFSMVGEAFTQEFLVQLGATTFVPDYAAPIVIVSGTAIDGVLLNCDGHVVSDENVPWGASGVFHKDGRVLEIELREY